MDTTGLGLHVRSVGLGQGATGCTRSFRDFNRFAIDVRRLTHLVPHFALERPQRQREVAQHGRVEGEASHVDGEGPPSHLSRPAGDLRTRVCVGSST